MKRTFIAAAAGLVMSATAAHAQCIQSTDDAVADALKSHGEELVHTHEDENGTYHLYMDFNDGSWSDVGTPKANPALRCMLGSERITGISAFNLMSNPTTKRALEHFHPGYEPPTAPLTMI